MSSIRRGTGTDNMFATARAALAGISASQIAKNSQVEVPAQGAQKSPKTIHNSHLMFE
jgi:hypothetical protein